MRHIWKTAAFVATALTIASCNERKFTVEGQIDNAKDSVLYFENVGLEGINTLDSIKLDDSGNFSFSEAAPGAPEFYRLRIADQIAFVSQTRSSTSASTPLKPYSSRDNIREWLLTTRLVALTTVKKSRNLP